jgi:hypothetical protein
LEGKGPARRDWGWRGGAPVCTLHAA